MNYLKTTIFGFSVVILATMAFVLNAGVVQAKVHFRPTDNWLLQAGFSYDTSPVDSDDRTPDMPIDRQIRYATGVQYKWSDRLSTGAQFVYAD